MGVVRGLLEEKVLYEQPIAPLNSTLVFELVHLRSAEVLEDHQDHRLWILYKHLLLEGIEIASCLQCCPQVQTTEMVVQMTYAALQTGGSHKRCCHSKIPRKPQDAVLFLRMGLPHADRPTKKCACGSCLLSESHIILLISLRREAVKNIWPIWSLLLVAHSQNVPELMSHVSDLRKC